MKKMFSFVLTTFVVNTLSLWAIVDSEEEIYAPAAEMKMLDDAMNRGIQEQRERNLQTPMQTPMMIMEEDDLFAAASEFQLIGDQYVLEKQVQDTENTEVKTKLQNRVLTITEIKRIEQVTIEESVTLGANATKKQYFMSTTSETLTLPQDADESTFKSEYKNGALKITLQKK